jgi:hypothetical protein
LEFVAERIPVTVQYGGEHWNISEVRIAIGRRREWWASSRSDIAMNDINN